MEKAFFSWSGGKDAALALFRAKQQGWAIDRLLTNVNPQQNRISMHGVRTELVNQQARLMQMIFDTVLLPEHPSMEVYEEAMKSKLAQLVEQGYTTALYGDIFLEDLKVYREKQLEAVHLQASFPVWKEDPKALLNDFFELGFKAIVIAIDAAKLHQSFCGRLLDEGLIADLPEGVDVCGENGEFHTFVFDGPLFSSPVQFEKGEVVYRTYPGPGGKEAGFYFCDLLPV